MNVQSMKASDRGTEARVRAVVVYRHALLRDLAVRVLSDAGVDVAAVLRPEELGSATLQELRADVVVVDQAANELLQGFSRATVFSRDPGSASRVVTIGLVDTTMVVCCKRLVADATAENLVEAVVGGAVAGPSRSA